MLIFCLHSCFIPECTLDSMPSSTIPMYSTKVEGRPNHTSHLSDRVERIGSMFNEDKVPEEGDPGNTDNENCWFPTVTEWCREQGEWTTSN